MNSLLQTGPTLAAARGAVILVHGRGGSAEGLLDLARDSNALGIDGVSFLAPQAEHSTWYPQSFLAPIAQNEPWLTAALARLDQVVAEVLAAGRFHEQIALVGFSQGACLTLEYLVRNPKTFGAVVAWTGGWIGPLGTERTLGFEQRGALANVPVLLTSGDPDPHVPWPRVEETALLLRAMGAEVDLRRYPGRPHTVGKDELVAARALLQRTIGQG